jgi:hypothetical protein
VDIRGLYKGLPKETLWRAAEDYLFGGWSGKIIKDRYGLKEEDYRGVVDRVIILKTWQEETVGVQDKLPYLHELATRVN